MEKAIYAEMERTVLDFLQFPSKSLNNIPRVRGRPRTDALEEKQVVLLTSQFSTRGVWKIRLIWSTQSLTAMTSDDG